MDVKNLIAPFIGYTGAQNQIQRSNGREFVYVKNLSSWKTHPMRKHNLTHAESVRYHGKKKLPKYDLSGVYTVMHVSKLV